MFNKRFLCILIISVLFPLISFADTTNNNVLVVKMHLTKMKNNLDQKKHYKYQLLELLLNQTKKEYGEYKIELVELETQKRLIKLADEGELSLIMTMTTKDREERLIPIRIPIYKGLYGFRIFIINKSDQHKFKAVKNEGDLKKLWAGQGNHWPDYKILEANGYKITGTPVYLNLFDMLEKKRFDYFPRGLHEPWLELKRHPNKDFTIEKNLCINYPAPGYIFVSPKYKKLAERLKKGFLMAINDGSFDHFFNNHPDIKAALKKGNLKKRKIFYLNNPLLSKQTPLNNERYWYKP
ncbi:MAG: hypothetical protein GY797_31870 [Deltaproteobacteria bacterium]|nr:hypothetical protein [Deltaproteobacteria bacterium]